MFLTNKPKTVHVIHHNDSDGRMAGAIVGYYYKKNYPGLVDIKYYESGYSFSFVTMDVNKDDLIYIVDFCVPAKEMQEFVNKLTLENVFWIDHHIGSFKTYEGMFSGMEPRGVRSCSFSGCALTWLYLFNPSYITELKTMNRELKLDLPKFDELIPTAIKYIGDYDNWCWKFPDSHDLFITTVVKPGPENNEAYWFSLINASEHMLKDMIHKGSIINAFKSEEFALQIIEHSYPCKVKGFENFKACVTISGRGSLTFDSVKDKYDIGIIINFNINKTFTISVYDLHDKQNDILPICKKYGGGGHNGAGGFTVKSIDEFLSLM